VAFFAILPTPADARATQGKAAGRDRPLRPYALKVGEATYDALESLGSSGPPARSFREAITAIASRSYYQFARRLVVEFTCDPPDVAEIDALRRADAHSELRRWLAGDRRVNNQLRNPGGLIQYPNNRYIDEFINLKIACI